jgi:hypothetical protein
MEKKNKPKVENKEDSKKVEETQEKKTQRLKKSELPMDQSF